MNLQVTGIESHTSRHGGLFYHIFFKGEDCKSYLTHAYPTWEGRPMRNFARWDNIMVKFRNAQITGKELWVGGAVIKKGNIINADSPVHTITRGEGK